MHKLMNKDKIILRFTARMVPGARQASVSAAEAGRRFVLSYFLMDDSILIFEPPVRNRCRRAGCLEGFGGRGRV